jgi:D-alanine-D-alanine ligase-like ATP-grasp enzyme
MTQSSLVPKIAQQRGLSFDELVALILNHAQND